ncbi:MAG TPA: ferritin-like domain-containing protein [Polyangiaceae bacterium]|nr:ferritin-like domain-containing protein [Polyangiaceae bacterium]
MRPSPVLVTILAAIACDTETFQSTGCFNTETELEHCPPAAEVAPSNLYLPGLCGDDLEISSVDGEGTPTDIHGQDGSSTPGCCYPVTVVDTDTGAECVVGRPYRDGDELRCAPVNAGQIADARAAAWLRAGALEHASVAAFARLSLQLMACGAPNDLLALVHQAAREETEHAEACWAMAKQLGVNAIEMGRFPFDGSVTVDDSLAKLASETVREGCVAETLGAHLVQVAADATRDPQIKSVLEKIAEEETRHAALSFRIVVWALRVGGVQVRQAVLEAFASPLPRVDIEELALRADIDPDLLVRAAQAGVDEVIRPAAATMLAA